MTDWQSEAAPVVAERIMARVGERHPNKTKRLRTFEERLESRMSPLLEKMHDLYGWRWDFAWWLEGVIEVAADAFLRRDKTLRRLDAEASLDWLNDPATVWAMAYTDRLCGRFADLPETAEHLRSLGVTHLHLMPPFERPEGGGDGGYAVASYRDMHPPLGTTVELREAIARLRDEGIQVVLDFVANHTAENHFWAEAAKKGDERFRAFFLMFPDRTQPEEFLPHLRSIFPDRGGDAFTWRPDVAGPDGGMWVWTTFYGYQWDLDYRNPDVLVEMARELLFVVNLGVSVVRMDATPFLWKKLGSSCENLEEAHIVLQILDLLVELAAPSVELLSEAIVHPDDVSRFVRADECRLGYNPVVMSTIWDAVATRDTRLLRMSLEHRQVLAEGCQWLTYLRSHDDIGWGFADEDAEALGIDPQAHRRFLTDFYVGEFPGSFGRGLRFQQNPVTGDCRVSGTLASLAGLEDAAESQELAAIDMAVDRILAMHTLMATSSGIPLLYLGDALGLLNDRSYVERIDEADDNRWLHRPFFDWAMLSRLEAGTEGQSRLLSGVRRLMQMRTGLPALARAGVKVTDQTDVAVIGYVRGDSEHRLEIVVNMSDRDATGVVESRGLDLWSGRTIGAGLCRLTPYQVLVIAGDADGAEATSMVRT